MRAALPDGRPLRDHLLEVAARVPSVQADLTPPMVDPDAVWILSAFADLESARSGGLGGPKPLAWSELESWLRVTGTVVTHEDLATLRAMDAAAIAAYHTSVPRE